MASYLVSRKVCAATFSRLHQLSHVNKSMRLVNSHKCIDSYLTYHHVRHASFFGSSKATEWTKAVTEAERIVGYPTSFLSLRCLLSDELSNVALQMRKLVGTKHPLLQTARGFVYDGSHNVQTKGLIVLLMSKAAGPTEPELIEPQDENSVIENMVSGIYPSQRSLAEITEMIHTAYLIHKGVVNLDSLTPSHGPKEDMEFGNKMAVLSGDFLLANASTALADLFNTYVVELMSSAIRDMMMAEFTSLRDSHGEASLPPGSVSMADWEQQTYLSSGSLLSKGCQSAMILARHTDAVQQKAFTFGKYMALAHQLHSDLEAVLKPSDGNFHVTLAPVMLHLSHRPDDVRFKDLLSQRKHSKICTLLRDSGATQECEHLCETYSEKAQEALSIYPDSDAKDALTKIVKATIKT